MLHLLAGIAWDPQIRGFLAVGVGVVVLLGSVYLLLGTNLGSRLGFLIAISAIFGWCTIMGLTWWMYGTIGMLGEAPKWEVVGVVYPGTRRTPRWRRPRSLDTSALPDPEELNELEGDELDETADEVEPTLGGWKLLPESNPAFGEAKATVDEHFGEHPDEELGLEARGRLRHRVLLRARGQGRPARRPEPDRSAHHQAQEHVLADPAPAALRHHPGPAGDRAGAGAGRGAAHPGGRSRTSRSCR